MNNPIELTPDEAQLLEALKYAAGIKAPAHQAARIIEYEKLYSKTQEFLFEARSPLETNNSLKWTALQGLLKKGALLNENYQEVASNYRVAYADLGLITFRLDDENLKEFKVRHQRLLENRYELRKAKRKVNNIMKQGFDDSKHLLEQHTLRAAIRNENFFIKSLQNKIDIQQSKGAKDKLLLHHLQVQIENHKVTKLNLISQLENTRQQLQEAKRQFKEQARALVLNNAAMKL